MRTSGVAGNSGSLVLADSGLFLAALFGITLSVLLFGLILGFTLVRVRLQPISRTRARHLFMVNRA